MSFGALLIHCLRHARASCALALLALASVFGAAWAQTCAVPGWDGPVTASGVINSYHGGSGSPSAGASSISVASATGQRTNTRALRAGDLILVIQMQDSSSPSNAGQYEYAQIVAISGTTLSLNAPLANSYAQSMNTSNVRNWQVVWVPQYSAATISGTVSADRWTINTSTGVATGGVVAMDVAGSLAINGTITAAGSGFRGGAGFHGTGNRAGGAYTDTDYNFTTTVASMNGAPKGEGIEGTPFMVFDGTATPVNYFTLLGQGYAAGAAGRGPRSNAAGGGNDGEPVASGNQYNSGGGGGGNGGAGGRGGNAWNSNGSGGALNQPLGGNTGNEAGGLGGNAMTNSATRLVMGGGGGAGTANNGTTPANSVTTWPPTTSTVANGADGPISSSGASGGGIVLVRAGSLSATAGVIDASGYNAHNKSPTSNTDSAGGGGAGGSVVVVAGSGTGAGLTIRARGGYGGRSDYFNHGPGGGAGGGYVLTNFAGATLDVTGGLNGLDACCGGTGGNGSPKAWNATAGSNGVSSTGGGSATGVQSSYACLPVINVTKTTLTPTITTATGATAVYSINLSNSGGAASNVFLLDATLPPGWAYTSTPAATFTYSPAPPPAGNSPAAGAETTSAGTPGALPVSTVATANSATAVSLRASGSAPGVTPTTGSNNPNFGSFYLPQNGSITVSFVATIPNTATVGTYHNPAGVVFLDPTRSSTAVRMVTPASQANANRSGTNYSANTTYASGATSSVLGSNYSGLAGGPTTEDVQLLPDFSITKTAPASATPGRTISYTITPRNNGRAIGSLTYSVNQASDVTTANVPATLGSNPVTVTDTLPAGVTVGAVFTGTGWTCTGTSPMVCTLANASAYPIAASTNFASLTGTATLTQACSGATPQTNSVAISIAAGETLTADNTATAVTTPTCTTANVQVTKTNGTGSVASGSTTSYTVTVSNLGPGSAADMTLTDSAGTGLNCTSATCAAAGGAVCPAASMPFGSLTTGVQIATFPSGSTATFVVTCGVTATGF
ncbi:MAG: DUF11 domain-containing protein [Ramlibacter sp.]|nr:DUF11 domain-containing protein [Ramlibacter sp.]